MEPTQPLLKDWRFASKHLKDLIIGDVSKGVATRSKLHELKNILEAEADSYWLLAMQESSINLSANKFGTLFLDPMIDQLLVLNGFL